MDLITQFPEYWGLIAIAVAGVTAIVGILGDVKDKETNRLTIWGKVLFCVTAVSTVGALVAQFLANRASDQRDKKAQEDTMQLLTQTHDSIIQLSRILQPLEQPTVTLFVDLTCGNAAYEAFCASAEHQAKEAIAEHQKILAGVKASSEEMRRALDSKIFSIPAKDFDWSKWPTGIGPIIPILQLHIFKTKEKFEEYAEGNCLNCSDVGDLNLVANVITKESFHVTFSATNEIIGVSFLVKPEDIRPEVRTTEVLSIPDLQGAVVAIFSPGSFEVLTPKSIFIDTPKGQRIRGDFQVREDGGDKIFFALLTRS